MVVSVVCVLVLLVTICRLATLCAAAQDRRIMRRRLELEILEARLAPAVLNFTVNSNQDPPNPPAGTTTLRSAMTAGNQADQININFDPTTMTGATITLATPIVAT